jgi:AraC family transcriptional regulator
MPIKKPIYIDRATADTTASILPCSPLLSSVNAGWDNLFLEYHYQPSGEHEEISAMAHSLAIFTKVAPGGIAERTVDDRSYRHSVHPGNILLIPANVGVKCNWLGDSEFILLGFHPAIFARTLDEAIAWDKISLIPQIGIDDPLIFQLGLALKNVLAIHLSDRYTSSQGDRLYLDTIVNTLLLHLIKHYSGKKITFTNPQEGLSQHKLRRVIDYINVNLHCNLTLTELADLVQLSIRHFSLLFKQSTGYTPHQYVILTRVETAKKLLLTEAAIADIAQTVGFANQSHLNLHFKRLVGITPKQFTQRAKV